MKKVIVTALAFLLVLTTVYTNRTEAYAEDYFALMSYRWRDNVVGNFEDKEDLVDNEYIQEYIENLSLEATDVYETMNKNNDGNMLWERPATSTKSSHLSTQFVNLGVLAKSYGTMNSKYYKDPEVKELILNGLEYLVDVEKYDGNGYYGNWWDWQIGVPTHFLNILFIMKDELPAGKLDKYVTVLHKYVPDPYKQIYSNVGGETFIPIKYTGSKTDGANRTDLAHVVLGIGVLKQDASIIKLSLESIEEVFDYVDKGNGFYEDGMFIYHEDNPYIGSYGVSLFKAVSSILSVVADTPYDMEQSMKEHFIGLVSDSTLPFINKGKFVGMVEGRSVSRAGNHTENALGSPIVKTLAIASQISDDPVSQNMFKAVKYWVSQDEDYYVSITGSYEELKAIVSVIEANVDLEGFVPFDGSKVFAAGDRFVYSDENTYFGLSMHSNRISAYTVGNGENLKGWHLSDGFMYLMNEDKQFGKSYWPTVDWYRLPGTTVDTRVLQPARADWASHRGRSAWAGGTYSNKNASVSMQLDKVGAKNNNANMNMDLMAKKSWFVIDGHIVSLGSDINGTSPQTIESIIENKLLDDTMNYTLIDSNGNLVESDRDVELGDTLLLKADDAKNNMGYTFLDEMSLNIFNETRSGSYRELNNGQSDAIYTEDFLKIILNHGSSINGGKYAYIQSPAATEETLSEDATRFEVINNDKDVQAIKDTKTKTMAATVWNTDGASVENITVDKAGALLFEEKALYSELFISDPTQALDKITVTLEDALDSQQIIVSDAVTLLSDTEFEIDLSVKNGHTHSIKFIKPVDKVELEDVAEELEQTEQEALTPYGRLQLVKLTKAVNEVINNPIASKDDVDAIKAQAVEVMNELDYLLNTEALEQAISKFEHLDEEIYVEASLDEYKQAIYELKDLKENYDIFKQLSITQEEIDEKVEDVADAFKTIKFNKDSLNYKQFNSLNKKIEKLDKDKYTTVSYEIVSIKLREVKRQLQDPYLTQEKLDNKVSELNDLYSKLEVK